MLVANAETRRDARQYKSDLLSTMFPAAVAEAAAAAAATVRRRRRSRGAGVAEVASAATAEAGSDGIAGSSAISALPPDGNIRGIGFGAKITSGAGLDETAIRVYVRAKQPRRTLTNAERVPEQINGMPTDVIPVGDIAAAAVPCGVSVGHVKVTAGTIGCVVTLASRPGRFFILSNNHVLANANAAQVDDHIIQPGTLDGGRLPHIATLTEFEPLRFDGSRNSMDAAVAELLDPANVTPDLKVIGHLAQPVFEPAVYQSVRKHGRTTLHTLGVIMDVAADIRVGYAFGQIASFEDQLAVAGVNGWFADRGDSGSVVVDAVSRRPVALLFAVAQGMTFCNPIQPVLDRFGAAIAFGGV